MKKKRKLLRFGGAHKRLTLRLPQPLVKALTKIANKKSISVNRLMCEYLDRATP